MRAAILLTVILAIAATAGAQTAGIPTFFHSWVKVGIPNTPAVLEIGDPDVVSPGRYLSADIVWALPSNYQGLKIPGHGTLLLAPTHILGSIRVTLQKKGWGFANLYWTTTVVPLPQLPTSLRGMTIDTQALAYKAWFGRSVSKLSTKDTFALY